MSNPKLGFNAANSQYYNQDSLTIDLMKGASQWLEQSGWNATEFDTYMAARAGGYNQDWLPALPAGRSVLCLVKDTPYSFSVTPPVDPRYPRPFRSGKYVLTWTGACTCSFNGLPAGISETSVGSNRKEVTFPTAEINAIHMIISNNTGGAVTCNDAKIYHIDDEADLLAGKIFSSFALAKFKGASTIRLLDLIKTMLWGVEDQYTYASLPVTTSIGAGGLLTESSRRWVHFPATAAGKLAMAVSALNGGKPVDIWIPFPVRMALTAATQYLTDLFSTHTIGKVKVEAGNEIWNYGSPFYKQSEWYNNIYLGGDEAGGNAQQRNVYKINGTLYAKPYARAGALGSYTYKENGTNTDIKPWEIAQSMMAYQAVDLWVAAEAIYPRNRVVRVLGAQNTNAAFSAYSLFAITTKLGASGTVASKLDALAVASYVKMGEPTQLVTPGDNLNEFGQQKETRPDDQLGAKFYAQGNAQQLYYDKIKSYIDNTLYPSIVAAKNDLTAKASPAVILAYESWRHTNTFIMTEGFGALCNSAVDTANNALTYNPQGGQYSAIARDTMFDNGDVIKIKQGDPVPFNGASYDTFNIFFTQFNTINYLFKEVFVRRHATANKLTLHKSQADAISGANILTLQNNGSQVTFVNMTRVKAMEDLQRTFARSELCRQLFVYWWNKIIKPFYAEANLYTQSGWNDSFGETWGLVESNFVADTPVAVQARKMNDIGDSCATLLA